MPQLLHKTREISLNFLAAAMIALPASAVYAQDAEKVDVPLNIRTPDVKMNRAVARPTSKCPNPVKAEMLPSTGFSVFIAGASMDNTPQGHLSSLVEEAPCVVTKTALDAQATPPSFVAENLKMSLEHSGSPVVTCSTVAGNYVSVSRYVGDKGLALLKEEINKSASEVEEPSSQTTCSVISGNKKNIMETAAVKSRADNSEDRTVPSATTTFVACSGTYGSTSYSFAHLGNNAWETVRSYLNGMPHQHNSLGQIRSSGKLRCASLLSDNSEGPSSEDLSPEVRAKRPQVQGKEAPRAASALQRN